MSQYVDCDECGSKAYKNQICVCPPDAAFGDLTPDIEKYKIHILDAINLVLAADAGDDKAAWNITGLYQTPDELLGLIQAQAWVISGLVSLLDSEAKVRLNGEQALNRLRDRLLGDSPGCQGHHDTD
jgi:hypothetical protein